MAVDAISIRKDVINELSHIKLDMLKIAEINYMCRLQYNCANGTNQLVIMA